MPSHPWFETLRRDLLRQGLPTSCVNRYLRELADHAADEAAATGQKEALSDGGLVCLLGGHQVLVEQARLQYRSSTFSGRHPILMFVLAPIPMVLAAWLAYFLATGLVFLGIGYLMYGPAVAGTFDAMEYWPAPAWIALMTVIVLGAVVPPLLLLLWYARLARRCGRSWRWLAVACVLLAWLAASYSWHVEVPDQLLISWALGRSPSALHSVCQGGLLLVVGGLLVWRERRQAMPRGASY